jgi:hypothetical protein
LSEVVNFTIFLLAVFVLKKIGPQMCQIKLQSE